MPYKTRKVRNKPCYKVYNPVSKKVFSKCTTRDNAKRQIRLLQAIENNKKFAEKVRNGRRITSNVTTQKKRPKNNTTRKIKKT